jgi:hypothetical protein
MGPEVSLPGDFPARYLLSATYKMNPETAPKADKIEAAINLVVCSFLFGYRATIIELQIMV